MLLAYSSYALKKFDHQTNSSTQAKKWKEY